MPGEVKNIAILGANKKALGLLPLILGDSRSKLVMIADSNPDAMLFKLEELGYRLASKHGIKVARGVDELRSVPTLDIVIDTVQDPETEKFLQLPEFRDVEKLGPLSARLIWSVRSTPRGPEGGSEQATLLSSLREIVDAVRLTIDRKELLSVILSLATESTRAERGSIMLISPEDKTLRVEIARGMDEEVVRKIRVPLGEGIAGRVAKEGKPLMISGKARSEEFSLVRERSDVKSALCVPLMVNGDIIGVINVNSSESAHAFTEEDLSFLSSLAGLAAEVIQRSNEYQELRVDAAKFTFWKELESVVSSPISMDKRLNAVCRRLADFIPGFTCFMYIYDEERGRLFLKGASIKDTKDLGPLSLGPGEGVEGWSMESLKDVILVDRAQEGRIKRVYLSLPMAAQGRFVGTLSGHLVSSEGLSKYNESFLKDIRSLIAEGLYASQEKERQVLRSRKFLSVDEAGLEIVSMRDQERLLKIIATTPAAIIGAEGSVLRLRQDGTSVFQTRASHGLEDRKVREYILPIEKETVTEVLRKKAAVRREFSEEASPYVRGVLSVPLFLDERLHGVLTLFNKTGEGTVHPCAFSETDREILSRFAVYAEKALSNLRHLGGIRPPARPQEAAGETKRDTAREALRKKVEEELNRARRFDKKFVVATVRVAGLKVVSIDNRDDFMERLLGSVRSKVRNFDTVMVLDAETFGLLFPDTEERVSRMLEGITENLSSNEVINKAFVEGDVYIHYGYAVFPDDGDSFTELFHKASSSRKLNLTRH